MTIPAFVAAGENFLYIFKARLRGSTPCRFAPGVDPGRADPESNAGHDEAPDILGSRTARASR